MGAIIGGVVGGIILVAIIVAVVVYCFCCRRNESEFVDDQSAKANP